VSQGLQPQAQALFARLELQVNFRLARFCRVHHVVDAGIGLYQTFQLGGGGRQQLRTVRAQGQFDVVVSIAFLKKEIDFTPTDVADALPPIPNERLHLHVLPSQRGQLQPNAAHMFPNQGFYADYDALVAIRAGEFGVPFGPQLEQRVLHPADQGLHLGVGRALRHLQGHPETILGHVRIDGLPHAVAGHQGPTDYQQGGKQLHRQVTPVQRSLQPRPIDFDDEILQSPIQLAS